MVKVFEKLTAKITELTSGVDTWEDRHLFRMKHRSQHPNSHICGVSNGNKTIVRKAISTPK